MKMGYSEEEIFTELHESERDRKRRRMLAKVNETVEAHRLQLMKDLQALEKLATWRRMNGFDRIVDGEDNWFHGPRSFPPTPETFAASLWSEVNTLKYAISMLRQKVSNLINAIEQGKVSGEEFAILKRLVEKRGREAAQVTVTPVGTVQYCSTRPLNPEIPSDVHVNMEGQGLDEPGADGAQIIIGWYGFLNTRTAVSPDLGDRTNHRRRLLDPGRGFKPGGTHFSHDGTRGHASRQNYSDNICRHLFTNGTRY